MENFGIRCRNKKDADNLISALQDKYEVTQDCTGGLYCGITLKWYYKARQLDISMPNYVKYILYKFQHSTITRPQHSSHQWTLPNYRSTVPQLAHPTDDSQEINPYKSRNVQQFVETFLYYARAIDLKILVTLNTILAEQ